MKSANIITCILLLAAIASPTFARTNSFESAQQAYDTKDFEKAHDIYTSLAAEGQVSGELFYNLGNTWYRLGQPGQAVLSYRRARMFLPRDPDVRANEEYVRTQTGAPPPPSPSVPTRLLEFLSFGEWFALALPAFWSSILLTAARLLPRTPKPVLRPILIGSTGLLFTAVIGMLHWHLLHKNPEYVVIQADVQALYAPLKRSTPHFTAPEGAILKLKERENGWLHIQLGQRSGWIRSEQASPVTPFSFFLASSSPYSGAPGRRAPPSFLEYQFGVRGRSTSLEYVRRRGMHFGAPCRLGRSGRTS